MLNRFHFFSLSVACALTLICSAHAAPIADAGTQLNQIAEKYFEARLALDPLEGSSTTGDVRFENQLAITIAPKHRAKSLQLARNVLRELEGLNVSTLSASDQISFAMLQRELQLQVESAAFPDHLLPIDQYGGLPVAVAQYGSGNDIQPLKTVLQYQHYLQRLEQLPRWIDQAIANMREGMATQVVQPRVLIEEGLPSLESLTENDEEKNAFFLALKKMPDTFSQEEKNQLTKAYHKTIKTQLIPATKKLVTFLKKDYLPHTRTTAGLSALPNGEKWYAFDVKYHTTTDLSPDEIHRLGLSEVERIRNEMEKVKTSFQFKGSLTEFLQWQSNAAEFRPFKTEKEILDAYATLNQKIITKLPTLFTRIPKTPLTILPEPELTRATASDHYNPPALDGSRPGTFYAVIEDPTAYRVTNMTSLFLHEGQPGHHFHIALQQELALPKFRQFGWQTAYGEGWALYAETLGIEMGLYDDKVQYLGHLKLELMRAVRLVVDTGLHAKGWSREKTMEYMITTEGRSEAEASRITQRYMAWPGQALGYKIGALNFQSLRAQAEKQLGAKFNLSRFHDMLLSDGSMPIAILNAKVENWIKSQE